jgi:hypothetical protein
MGAACSDRIECRPSLRIRIKRGLCQAVSGHRNQPRNHSKLYIARITAHGAGENLSGTQGGLSLENDCRQQSPSADSQVARQGCHHGSDGHHRAAPFGRAIRCLQHDSGRDVAGGAIGGLRPCPSDRAFHQPTGSPGRGSCRTNGFSEDPLGQHLVRCHGAQWHRFWN